MQTKIEERAQRWIPVGERLPEIKDRVLVHSDRRVFIAHRCNAVSTYCAWIGEDGYALWPPSHWMPLPGGPNNREVK
jgi:hypothetical protein